MLRRIFRLPLTGAILLLATVAPGFANDAEPKLVGRAIADFVARDAGGKEHALRDFAEQNVIVVAFLGTECPLAKLYTPRLIALQKEFAERKVGFLAIDSNQQDSLAELQHFARAFELTFPLVKDNTGELAEAFGARRTPQVFVLDRERKIRYAGRIDDQYGYDRGVGYQRPSPEQTNLKDAIAAVLDGKEISQPETEVVGCLIGLPRTPQADSEVTYSNQIARIFQKHCVECHRPGEIGPFSLLSYDDARGWGEMIQEVVAEKRMPPWGANPKYGKFLNDISLSSEDEEAITTWVKNGCPEGDPSDLPPAREFVEGWGIPTPSVVIPMAEKPYVVPAEGVVEYQYFEVDPGWKEDVWIKAAEARPGNRSVVHHIIVFVKEPGGGVGLMGEHGVGPNDLLSGYAPGMPPMRGHHGLGRKIKAGSKLVFQMHYTPNGKEAGDLSTLGLVYAKPEEVKHDVRSGAAMQLNLDIPPEADDYVARSKKKFRDDTLLLSLMPHMHLRGTSFRYELEHPDGHREVLLDVPRYDFNWQLVYILEKPVVIPAGSTLHCEAHYDNSPNNLANPDPKQRVRWGDQTWEEMMIGWYTASELKPEDKRELAGPAAGGE